MASLIKNQILKYLSRYFKNLSTDKINFNTIKGEGEVTALELDEIALTDLLELPAWMKITNAECNKVKFHIPWTKLKSEPMIWNLDEVKVKIETCDELRTPDEVFTNLIQSPGKYNFIIRTVDGMTINVNTVSVDFSSATFTASLQVLRIEVESRSSSWEKCNLRHTRIKDSKRGQILLFKEIRWQNVRMEARSITESDLPPLRLITNDAVCRIIIKKRLSDCFIMGSKLVLILKTLLWVLTDSQLKAALHFLDSLSGLIKKANEIVRKKKAARKLEVLPEYQAQKSQAETMQGNSAVSHIFACHDVVETSYHLIAHNIDLHFSDDPGPERSAHPDLQNGGSISVNLTNFQADFYPYHLAVKDREHWGLYKSARYPHPQWLLESQNDFRNLLLSLVEDDFPSHCERVHQMDMLNNSVIFQPSVRKNYNLRNYLNDQFNKIMTSCTVLRISDFFVSRVSSTSRKTSVKEFIKADKNRYKLPETEIIHVEFTYYYYPGDIQFPLPPPKFYVQIYPILIHFDVLTIIWLNTFFLNLYKSLLTTSTAQNNQQVSQLFYFDMKVEITMPQIIFESREDKSIPKDQPMSFQLEISKISVTNARSISGVSSRSNLSKVVSACQMKSLFLNDEFPSKESDYCAVTEKFINHVQGKDNIRSLPTKLFSSNDNDVSKVLFQELLWIDAKDVWCVYLESIYGDFGGIRAVGNSSVPFLDAFPLTVWVHMDPLLNTCDNKTANIHVLASVTNLISVQINKFQAMFLTKILKQFSELTTFLTLDSDNTMKDSTPASVVIATVIPQIEITLVTSSKSSGKESSGGDLDSSSVMPDSSSLDAQSVYCHNTQLNAFDFKNNAGDEMKMYPVSYPQCEFTGDDVKKYPQGDFEFKTPSKMSFSQVKKDFSNFMSMGFSSKSVDESCDVVSIRSDDSSDTENYLLRSGSDLLYLDDSDCMFRIDCRKKMRNVTITDASANVELADEAYETAAVVETPITTSSERDSFMSSFKRKDLVAATTFKLARLEFMMQSAGLNGSVKMQIHNIGVEECFSIPWDELQNKFNSRIRNWCEVDDVKSDLMWQSRIKLRLENIIQPPDKICAEDYNINLWRSTFLNVTIENLIMQLQPKTIKCLTEFFEDQKSEFGDQPISFDIYIDKVQLDFVEDNLYDQIPKSSQIIFNKLRLLRQKNEAINIQPAESCVHIVRNPNNVDDNTVEAMRNEIDLLRKRLAAMNYLKEENEALRQCQEETTHLRNCLMAAQNHVSDLLEQRRELLDRCSGLRSSYMSDNSTCKR